MSLISEIKKGNSKAFEELIDKHKIELYKVAKAILKNEEDVNDALQDTALSIYKNIGNIKNEKYFKTWATRITINNCYNIIQKNQINNKKIEKVEIQTTETESNFTNNLTEKIDLEKALQLLEEDLKIVTTLYYYNDLSIIEISKILEIPKGTVKSRIFRARQKLYEILSEKGGNENE